MGPDALSQRGDTAFVAELYRRMLERGAPEARSPRFRERLEVIVGKNSDAIDVLRTHAEATDYGRAVIEELHGLNQTHREFLA